MVERATLPMKRGEEIDKSLCCSNFLDFSRFDFPVVWSRENRFSQFRFSLASCVSERSHPI